MRTGRFASAVIITAMFNGCGGSSGLENSGGAGGSSKSSSASTGSAGSGGASVGSSGGAGQGGSAGGGSSSSSSSSQPPSCPNGSSCGGDLVGTWEVTSSCLALSGDLDVTMGSLGCKTVPVKGSLQVSGTWIAKADGTYKDSTTTKGSMTVPLDPSCLSVSSVPVECNNMGAAFNTLGWTNTTCSESGGKCSCQAETTLQGGLGVPSVYASDSGNYVAGASGLKVDEQVDYSYCVEGSKLTLTPKPTVLPVKGTIVLQKKVTPTGGTGGGTSTGGAKGGSTGGGGGSAGAGGKGGSGGTTNSGGTSTGTGGKGGSGGSTTGPGGTTSTGGTSTGGTSSVGGGSGSKPCDIYAAANNPCAAAHSTVRALFASYNGKLYQVRRASDKTTLDIGLLSPGGMADAAAQDAFCKGTTCLITKVYDQTKNGNFLGCQGKDLEMCPDAGSSQSGASPASATNESVKAGGTDVYALKMNVGNAYWRDGSKSGMPLKETMQGIYMVTSGEFFNGGCCFDYGNGPTDRKMSGGGTMDSVYFGNSKQWGYGAGNGPWVMADLEGGIFAGTERGQNTKVPSVTFRFVTAIEKNNNTKFALKGGDATSGKLTTYFEDKLPSGYKMDRRGSVILGSGGDCCYSNSTGSRGVFYEGAIVTGYPSDATEDLVQADIVSVGYAVK